jgi:hypothetical protein
MKEEGCVDTHFVEPLWDSCAASWTALIQSVTGSSIQLRFDQPFTLVPGGSRREAVKCSPSSHTYLFSYSVFFRSISEQIYRES